MNRVEKVAEEIKREASGIIRDELRDPRLGFVTLTRVEVAPDLRFARIYFSVYGDAKQWEDTEAGLKSAAGFIRRLLGERLNLRYVPEVAFKSDHSSEYSITIEERLKEIQALSREDAAKERTVRVAKKTSGRSRKKRK